jgi:uncharacterized membrane protein YdcZ (DUF606 family)
MAVRTDQRRHTPASRSRLTWTRILGIVLLGVGLLVTVVSLISLAVH